MAEEERQQVLVAQARMRLKAVERLQERREAEERRERDRREALELEDVVAGLRLAAVRRRDAHAAAPGPGRRGTW